ncbi:MAG: UDP-N-acetylglucosamine 2-epimerase [Candidatus Woesebacteria bacterium GW2011_GWA1_41_13b]|uniref:UDP-N-acetylglucosamine 2-epimerase n=2 Tax=Microgenomates group TaxID=1794810 RepID=A0A0G0UV19_9BACT|nr:MAG: UDP-N-acetylglucosamine 2-epimerase [Candidatus Woesebacteria bacterium GW2011_GWA1_41_13b]
MKILPERFKKNFFHNTMIYFIFGTVAELIKLFPVMKQFDRCHIGYKLVHTGQHAATMTQNIKRLHVQSPDFILTKRTENLKSISQMVLWIPSVLFHARTLPIKKSDYVIVHGDTMSTLLGLIIGKIFGAKILHIESGKRTHNLMKPFPEEIIRIIVSRLSDFCFATDQHDADNLAFRGNVFQTEGNTVVDSVREVLNYKPSPATRIYTRVSYILFLFGRQENILLKKNFDFIMDTLSLVLQKNVRVIWPIHAHTLHELHAKNYWGTVTKLQTQYQLEVAPPFDYVDFIFLLSHCLFVVTDGIGLQQEAYILNKPTLVLRDTTETPGIGETGMLSYFQQARVGMFLKTYSKLKRKKKIQTSPSKIIVDVVQKHIL